LGVDAIPLWQIHNARMDAVQNDDLWATLESLRDEGKIRYYGVLSAPPTAGSRKASQPCATAR
jgi:aryl-alcohol dehydrogenase-like predicted oxidoreductase